MASLLRRDPAGVLVMQAAKANALAPLPVTHSAICVIFTRLGHCPDILAQDQAQSGSSGKPPWSADVAQADDLLLQSVSSRYKLQMAEEDADVSD